MEGRRSEPFDFHLNNPGIRETLRASTFVEIKLGWANGAVASAAVLHTVGRGFESLFAHHFSYLCLHFLKLGSDFLATWLVGG